MRKRDKVRKLLLNEFQRLGIPADFDAEDLWIQEGGYRHHHWDLARWGLNVRARDARYYCVYSWDTMTDCARYGLVMDKRQDIGEYEVSSKKP